MEADTEKDALTVVIKDNGCGMTEEQVNHVTDPFFTTRTTRKVGLGVPFFKYAAESTGGSFTIQSEVGTGTVVTAVSVSYTHLDVYKRQVCKNALHSLYIFYSFL